MAKLGQMARINGNIQGNLGAQKELKNSVRHAPKHGKKPPVVLAKSVSDLFNKGKIR